MAFVAGEVVAPSDPRIVLEGQWGLQPGLAVTVNSGSRISFTFNGTAVQALFDVGGLEVAPHLWVSVDEAEPELHVVAQPVIELTAAEAGPHKVEIVVKDVNEHVNRWHPPFGCAVVFAGLVLGTGTRLRLSGRPSGPRLEFYGDSITQGVRALSEHPESEGADGTKSFAYLTARALGASAYQVGFGRQGVVRPGNGEVPGGIESFGWNFAGSPAERIEQPQVVVINLGVNDETLTAAQYGGYLARVRAAYGSSEIVALSPFNGKYAEEIEAAVKAGGDPAIRYVGTDGWITEDDCTDLLHPSVDGHAKIAARLTEELRAIL
ncbi:GDSL-type esterase/lipase family protein [Kribbella sp. CA-293567]|uniref:GDSL-type esterase/lipase family protein n=1 Tax=Kribbella sp. CA-293567 TaxID=3002436 RepID=UPI0022DD8E25|nr:GDSL-type esterase/lipase family protein [Kribbella sp. CA-293567]WBQ07786.1 GDSL-type esterase/lipase family protein [Kribbella sp. CA-293567]